MHLAKFALHLAKFAYPSAKPNACLLTIEIITHSQMLKKVVAFAPLICECGCMIDEETAERIRQIEKDALTGDRDSVVELVSIRQTYWCRYFEPLDIPRRHICIMWPEGMRGWISGYRNDAKIFCARVDAESAAAAEAVIRSCYGKSGRLIEIDSIDEKPLGWRPPSDRFPE